MRTYRKWKAIKNKSETTTTKTPRNRGEDTVKTEAYIALYMFKLKNTKYCHQPPESMRDSSSRSFLRTSRGNVFLPEIWFWNPELQKSKKIIFYCFNLFSFCWFITVATENNDTAIIFQLFKIIKYYCSIHSFLNQFAKTHIWFHFTH